MTWACGKGTAAHFPDPAGVASEAALLVLTTAAPKDIPAPEFTAAEDRVPTSVAPGTLPPALAASALNLAINPRPWPLGR